MDFKEKKKLRSDKFKKSFGKKLIPCSACNGSGYYDTTINGKIPKCESCAGTGKQRSI